MEKIKIAVIGSQDFIQDLHSIEPHMTDIEIDPYTYQDPYQSKELIQHLKPCDAIFFSGALPYYYSKEICDQLSVPSLFLEQNEMAVASSLLSITYHKKIPIDRISIDLMEALYTKHVSMDIGISIPAAHVLEYKERLPYQLDLTSIVQYHYSLHQLGNTDVALTSIHAVYDRLKELGVPTERMVDPIRSLLNGFQKVKSIALLNKKKASTISAIYLSHDQSHQEFNQWLQSFTHDIQGSGQSIDEHTYLLHSTVGHIESLVSHHTFEELISRWNGRMKIGFGYGTTAIETEQNAGIALRFAQNDPLGKCGYILTDDKNLLGPYPKEAKLQRLKNNHPKLFDIAKEIKISPGNLSKLIEFSRKRSSSQFTAAELTDYLQITRRSTERIIKKLVDHGSIRIVGEEMTYQQGRPRSIYELHLPF
ncbi:transcriptional regulator [Rossellomorea sp. GCM10028870]|uniref:transcriptional regulator n=1 Tax=Rossellomorea sp. GCM10028870 TaxID=3273426 RepID=UPI003607FA09